jgi:hypothetical protein
MIGQCLYRYFPGLTRALTVAPSFRLAAAKFDQLANLVEFPNARYQELQIIFVMLQDITLSKILVAFIPVAF